ncbi:MAG: flagellar hook-basal body complex protein FliE [bacterium]
MSPLENLNPLQSPEKILPGNKNVHKIKSNDSRVPSFSDTLNKFVKDVNSMQNYADRSIEKMVAGEITDVHQVMIAVEEANTAFSLMMEMRNKMQDAYQEILRMQI